MDNSEQKMRHTLSHVLAAAVKELYPTTMLGIGPTVKDGFYYDIDFREVKISDADLPKIEQKMHEIINQNLTLEKVAKSRVEALNWARENGEKYKIELIEDLPESEKVSFYKLGEIFEDLCKGPHIKNTNEIGAFKLVR